MMMMMATTININIVVVVIVVVISTYQVKSPVLQNRSSDESEQSLTALHT